MFRFVAQLFERFRSGVYNAVKLLCGFAEQLHGQRVALCFILNAAKRVDRFPINVIAIPQFAVCVGDGNAQLFIGFGVRARAFARRVHRLDIARHRFCEGVHLNVDKTGGVCVFLQFVRALPRVYRLHCKVIRIV